MASWGITGQMSESPLTSTDITGQKQFQHAEKFASQPTSNHHYDSSFRCECIPAPGLTSILPHPPSLHSTLRILPIMIRPHSVPTSGSAMHPTVPNTQRSAQSHPDARQHHPQQHRVPMSENGHFGTPFNLHVPSSSTSTGGSTSVPDTWQPARRELLRFGLASAVGGDSTHPACYNAGPFCRASPTSPHPHPPWAIKWQPG